MRAEAQQRRFDDLEQEFGELGSPPQWAGKPHRRIETMIESSAKRKSRKMKSTALKTILWKRTTTILKNMNCKTLIRKLALLAFVLSAPAALLQEFLVVIGKRTNGTIFYREVSPSVEGLYLYNRQLTEIALPEGLTSLKNLYLSDNELTSLTLPEGLTSLVLDLSGNRLTSLSLPADLTSLKGLWLGDNQLTSFNLLSGLTSLERLGLDGNQLTSLTLPAGLSSFGLDLFNNRLTSLTLPASVRLRVLDLRNNPIEQLLVPEEWI